MSRREIRLIKLDTSPGDGPIKCELLPPTSLIDAQGQYFTLSYCAGDPKVTKCIFVDGVKCNIFANLHHALILASHYWRETSRDGPFLLWIDQLCINQCNLKERSHQVNFMRHIYQSAERTIVCLSTSETSGRGMKWLKNMCESVPPREDDFPFLYADEEEVKDLQDAVEGGYKYENAVRMCERFKTEIYNTFKVSIDVRHDLQEHFRRFLQYIWNNAPNEEFINGWISFYRVLESPWWTRAWVCQEFLVSKKITFMFGHQLVSWEQSCGILQLFCELHTTVLSKRERFFGYRDLPSDHPEDIMYHRVVDHVHNRRLQRRVDQAGSLLRMKTRWTGSMDMTRLLAHSRRHCKSSDDRDRIYSFTGLTTLDYHIFPDYSPENTLSKLLIDTTKSIIRTEDSLEVLIQAAAYTVPRDPLTPSWVVDWTREELSKSDEDPNTEASKLRIGIPTTRAEASFRRVDSDNRSAIEALEVWGLCVGRIKSVRVSESSVIFKTYTGLEGRATLNAECLNEVWILRGLRMPMILRPYIDGYRLVSWAISENVRDGNGEIQQLALLMDLSNKGKIPRRRITLY